MLAVLISVFGALLQEAPQICRMRHSELPFFVWIMLSCCGVSLVYIKKIYIYIYTERDREREREGEAERERERETERERGRERGRLIRIETDRESVEGIRDSLWLIERMMTRSPQALVISKVTGPPSTTVITAIWMNTPLEDSLDSMSFHKGLCNIDGFHRMRPSSPCQLALCPGSTYTLQHQFQGHLVWASSHLSSSLCWVAETVDPLLYWPRHPR